MLIGVPKEIKSDEYRIGLTPESVKSLTQSGHQVMIENNAGLGIGKDNDAYEESGAEIVQTREEIFQRAEMIVKVKEITNLSSVKTISYKTKIIISCFYKNE